MKMPSCKAVLVAVFIGGALMGYLVACFMVSAPDESLPMDHEMGMSMQEMMMDMNASLRGKKGDDLDRAFLDEMIVHHEGAVEMAELLLAGTQRMELIELARNILSTQKAEIAQMRQWRNDWFSQGSDLNVQSDL